MKWPLSSGHFLAFRATLGWPFSSLEGRLRAALFLLVSQTNGDTDYRSPFPCLAQAWAEGPVHTVSIPRLTGLPPCVGDISNRPWTQGLCTGMEMRLGAAQFVRAGCFLAGLAIAAVLVAGWRVPAQKAPGASLRVTAAGTSELTASPTHPFLVASDLQPGHPVSRKVVLTNTMAQPLAVRVHALPADFDLDKLLQVKASAEGKAVFAGSLGELRHWSPRSFVVPRGGQTALATSFWVDRSSRKGYQQRQAEIKLEFKLAPAGRAG